MKIGEKFYSLIPLEDFKAVLGADDRDDKLCRFCLVTATHTIEQFCKRRLLAKKHFELVDFYGELFLPLREYPVRKVLAVYVMGGRKWGEDIGEMLEPDFYEVVPDCGTDEDMPFCLSFSPALKRYRGFTAVKVVYWAGYEVKEERKEKKEQWGAFVPPDLAAACLELAAWNMGRYKGRRIGMTGNVRGRGKDGEHFEMAMPENVKLLLEPYRRKVI